MSVVGDVVAGLLGVALGGVANVLADDLPLRQRPREPHCPHCGYPRRPSAWLGVGALLFGRWRCDACSRPLTPRHPLLEAALGVALVYLWNRYGLSVTGLFTMAYVWLAALIAVIDLEQRLILNVVMGPAILLALLEAALTPRLSLVDALLGGLTGFGVVFAFYLLGEVFRRAVSRLRGQAIEEVAFGFGDVTLATFAGLVLGRGAGVALMLVLAVAAGGVVALVYVVYRRAFTRQGYTVFTPLPYGPNILFGMLVVLIWQEEIGQLLRRALFGS